MKSVHNFTFLNYFDVLLLNLVLPMLYFALPVLNIGLLELNIVLPALYFVLPEHNIRLLVIDIDMLKSNFDIIINQKYLLLIVYLSFLFVYLL